LQDYRMEDSTSNQRQNCLRHLRPQKKPRSPPHTAKTTALTTSDRQNHHLHHLKSPLRWST
ncbi:hypothetical protein KUCAC02_032208, partial [Chaenocephalus aceratus]